MLNPTSIVTAIVAISAAAIAYRYLRNRQPNIVDNREKITTSSIPYNQRSLIETFSAPNAKNIQDNASKGSKAKSQDNAFPVPGSSWTRIVQSRGSEEGKGN